MMTHELKCWPEFFEPLAAGEKTFEYRRDDRGFEVGDVLVLREFRPSTIAADCRTVVPEAYTGRVRQFRVTYVLRAPKAGVPSGYCVMSLAPLP